MVNKDSKITYNFMVGAKNDKVYKILLPNLIHVEPKLWGADYFNLTINQLIFNVIYI
jgi:hypothetical protein